MKSCLMCLSVLFVLASPCFADIALVNGGFESAVIISHDPNAGFLEWSEAVPGWGHSSGEDSGWVYYGYAHIGMTAWFKLIDAPSFPKSNILPLQGSYSVAIHTGYEGGNAYLSQTCTVPANAGTIGMLAQGYLTVTFAGQPIAMVGQEGNQYRGDISSFAGQTGELRIIHTPPVNDYSWLVVDGVGFQTVPEPSTVCLLTGLFLAVAMARMRRGR